MKKRKTKKKLKTRFVPMRMSPEREYEMHDRHDADVSDAGDGGMIGESHTRTLNEIVAVLGKAMQTARKAGADVTDVKAEREKLASRYGGEENIPDNQKRRLDRIEQEQKEKQAAQPEPTPTDPAPQTVAPETTDDTQPPDRIGGMVNIGGITPKTPGSMGPEQSTVPTEPTEDAYQTEPIPPQAATPVKAATDEATPSASVNTVPDRSGGMQSFGYQGQDPRKVYNPQSSAQFQTQGFDFGMMKYNFMRESSVQSLLDEILNEKNVELNLTGSFGEPVRDKKQDDRAYIRAALFNAMKKRIK